MTSPPLQPRIAWGLYCLFLCAVTVLGSLGAHSTRRLGGAGSLDVALIDAVKQRDTATVQSLLTRRANPNVRDNTAYPLWKKQMAEPIQMWEPSTQNWKAQQRPKPAYPYSGPTAVMIAASQHDNATIQILVSAGADLNARGVSFGAAEYAVTDPSQDLEITVTPLMEALMGYGDESTLKLLLKLGANPNRPGNDGTTPLQLAHNLIPTTPYTPRMDQGLRNIEVLRKAGAREYGDPGSNPENQYATDEDYG